MGDGAHAAPVMASTTGSVRSDDPDILAVILASGVTIACWERSVPGAVTDWLDGLDWPAIDDLAFHAGAATTAPVILAHMAAAGYPAAPAAHWLAADIATLARRYALILDLRAVAVGLDVIETDACRRFHADHVTVRAITTYLGPGTQWLNAADADALAAGTALEALPIQQIATGGVALMKGKVWAPDQPCIHRSPPIMAGGGRRLTLVLDPAGSGSGRV